jgi:hypothetical protein
MPNLEDIVKTKVYIVRTIVYIVRSIVHIVYIVRKIERKEQYKRFYKDV